MLFSVLLPALLSVSGLVIDVGMLLRETGRLEQMADAAATAAARDLLHGKSISDATATATAMVTANAGTVATDVTVHIPPVSGPHAGNGSYAEVLVSRSVDTNLLDVGTTLSTVSARAVAGHEAVTGDTAIVVLSDRPVSWLNQYDADDAGLYVTGSNTVNITGAILVNDESGQFDESWNKAGRGAGFPYGAISSIPLYAPHVRVAGGVNDPTKFFGTISGVPPLSANRMAVDDPLKDLPVPTVIVDSTNVLPDEYGGVRVRINGSGQTEVYRTITGTTEVLGVGIAAEFEPGVYDWIRIQSAPAQFAPGVYIVRSVNPTTGIGVDIQGGSVVMDGIMFYVTDNATYAPASGLPDADNTVEDAPTASWTTLPGTQITLSANSRLKGLNDPASPYDGMVIFQRRSDRRWVRLEYQGAVNGQLRGTIYTPAAKTSVYTDRDVHCQFAVATLRLYNYNGLDVYPPKPFPPARDVFLVE